MSKKILGIMLGVTLTVGTVFAAVKFIEWINKQGENYGLAEFNELVKNQKTVEELNGTVVLDWMKNVKQEHLENLSYIVAYPTQEAVEKFHLKNFPENMDFNHNVLLFAFNKETYYPVKIQMISFETKEEKLDSILFNNNYYAVVEG